MYLQWDNGISSNFENNVCLLKLLPSVWESNSSNWKLLDNFSPELLNDPS